MLGDDDSYDSDGGNQPPANEELIYEAIHQTPVTGSAKDIRSQVYGANSPRYPTAKIEATRIPVTYAPTTQSPSEKPYMPGRWAQGASRLADHLDVSLAYLDRLSRTPGRDSIGKLVDTAALNLAVSPSTEDLVDNHHINAIKNHPDFEQTFKKPPLFVETPETIHVTSMFAHPQTRAVVPSLMARMHLDYPNAKLVADASLSKHSSRLSRHGKALGLPVEGSSFNPSMEPSNEIDYPEGDRLNEAPFVTSAKNVSRPNVIPAHEMQEARNFVRQKLRDKREASRPKPHLSPQFDQPRLPGMENY
jgi:hypothetical protein